MEYKVRKLHGELYKVMYYHDSILIDNMQRAFGTCIWLDNEWSKVCFALIRMVWDPGIEGFLHDRTM